MNLDFAGKKVLVRVDFNVPLDKKTLAITDDTRMRAAVPTIKTILEKGGAVILMSHLDRPLKKLREDGSIDVERFTLKNLINHLSELLDCPIQFASDCLGSEAATKSAALKSGEVLLLENTRFHKGEEKGDMKMAEELSKLGDVYVNDAFGTAHRDHASTATMARFFDKNHKTFGFLMQSEIDNAEKVLNNPARPYTAIIGGAKVSDKILIIEKLVEIVDNLIIGGGMAYTFMKAMGGTVGNSLCEDDRLDNARALMERAKAKGVNILLPEDSLAASEPKQSLAN